MVVLAVTWMAKVGHESDVAGIFSKLTEASRQEPGCAMYIVHRHKTDPRRFFIYEQYNDDAALEAHRAAPHFPPVRQEGTAQGRGSRGRQPVRASGLGAPSHARIAFTEYNSSSLDQFVQVGPSGSLPCDNPSQSYWLSCWPQELWARAQERPPQSKTVPDSINFIWKSIAKDFTRMCRRNAGGKMEFQADARCVYERSHIRRAGQACCLRERSVGRRKSSRGASSPNAAISGDQVPRNQNRDHGPPTRIILSNG